MAIRRIEQISCSLNLGLIYSLDYSYEPNGGTKIKVYFVNEQGEYIQPNLLPMQKAFIRIGSAQFSMYAVASGIEKSAGRRVIWVEFEDEFFMLSKYHVVWPGRGCGRNVIELGTPVDNRSLADKEGSSLDPTATKIASFTQLVDYEHSFNEFLAVLRTKFNVQVQTTFDSTIKRTDFYGSFLSVLQDWCNYYNLAFFFENGIIKIFDPVTLNITLPTQPVNAISYSDEQDIRSTYGKTVCNWFAQPGDEYLLNQSNTGDANNGPLLYRTHTLYPIGYEYGLTQPTMDANQVAAAQYGKNFWFLYNYWQGSTSQNCGFTPRLDISSNYSSVQGVRTLGGEVATSDEDQFNERFSAYYEYGQQIAGRWYLSNRLSNVSIDSTYTWFGSVYGADQNNQSTVEQALSIEPLYSNSSSSPQIVKGTTINQFYPGINYVGDRLYYNDQYTRPSGAFALSATLTTEVDNLYNTFFDLSNNAYDLNSQLIPVYGQAVYTAYKPVSFSQELQTKFQQVSSDAQLLKPRFDSIPIKGVKTQDYVATKTAEQNGGYKPDIVSNNDGPSVVSNTAVIKTRQNGDFSVYYNKYTACASASTQDGYYGFEFVPQQISSDNAIGVTFQKLANNTYKLNRDFGLINRLVNNPALSSLAQARTFPTRRVSYTLNYFESVPSNFLTNGLVGLSVSVSDNGVQATYSYSNEVLRVPDRTNQAMELEQKMRNSWIRQYQPQKVINELHRK